MLLTTADAALRRAVPAGPRWRWLVPGRVEVFGKRTDYAGGRSLLAAVPRGVAVVARDRDDGQVRDRREIWRRRRDDPRVTTRRGEVWRCVSVVVRRFASNFPHRLAPTSRLPAIFHVPPAPAVRARCSLASPALIRRRADARDEWCQAIRSSFDLAVILRRERSTPEISRVVTG
jgi:galactokinase